MEERKWMKVLKGLAAVLAALAALCAIIYFCTDSNLPGLVEKATGVPPGGAVYGEAGDEGEYPLNLEVCHFPNIKRGDFVFGGTWQAPGVVTDISYGAWSIEVEHRIDPSEEFVQVEAFGLMQYDTKWKDYKYTFTNKNWSIVPADVNESGRFEYPKGSFGTFLVYFPNIGDMDIGYYCIKFTINIDGEERTIYYPLWIDKDESYLGGSRRGE